MKKYFAFLLCCFCLSVLSSEVVAQNKTVVVQGQILDADKKPVNGVTVAELDDEGRTIKAAKTDIDGNFSIAVANINHKLSFSHISFKTLEQAIGTKTTFNVTLESVEKNMESIVIVASRKLDNGMLPINERSSTIAQSHISAKELEETGAFFSFRGLHEGLEIQC